jgi:hypothetical protein
MILTREQADNLTKEGFAELASDYATKLVHRLGNDREITILPEELIFDFGEAAERFKPKPNQGPTALFCCVIDLVGFYADGIAYIPLERFYDDKYLDTLVELGLRTSLENQEVISQRKKEIYSDPGFANFSSFEAEIGHIVEHRLYPWLNHGLGEAVDIFSQLYGAAYNLDYLSSKFGQLKEPMHTKRRMEIEIIKELTQILERTDTYLFEGKSKLKEILKQEVGEGWMNYEYGRISRDYVSTSHYEGLTLFREIYTLEGNDVNRSIDRFGELIQNPKITTTMKALRELGLPADRLAKYGPFLDKNIEKRVEMASLSDDL